MSRAGIHFIANMPTEEIFTAPLKNGIDGVVYASMPFVCGGTVVEDFHFVIRDGKIREGGWVLKVDSFLNHQIDIDLCNEIGQGISTAVSRG